MSKGPKLTGSKSISLALRSAIALGALVWVFRGQKWTQLADVFSRLNLAYFVLSLGVFASAQLLIGLRWWILLRAQSIRIDIGAAMRLHFLGLFYNNLMPGSVGGDLLKAWYATKHTDKRLEAVLSVFVDRAIGFLGMLAIAVVCYALFIGGKENIISSGQLHGSVESGPSIWSFAVWIPVVMGLVLCGLLVTRPGREALAGSVSYVWVHGCWIARRIRQAVIVYCSKPLTVLAAFALTVAVQVFVITAFWLLGMNLQLGAPARYYFVIFPVTWVLAAIPVSVAGVGVLEGGIRELFTRLAGVAAEKALALALCQRFVWILASLPGAAIHMFGAHLPKEFSIDEEQPTD